MAALAAAALVGALLAFPAAASGPPGGIYGGYATDVFAATKTPWPASLLLSADGKTIKSLFYFDAFTCSDGQSQQFAQELYDVKVSESGRFTESSVSSSKEAARTYRVRYDVSGVLTANGAKALVKDSLTVLEGGKVVATCKNAQGIQRLELTRKAGVLGGRTARYQPVTLELARGGTSIERVTIAWNTAKRCSPTPVQYAAPTTVTKIGLDESTVAKTGSASFEKKGSYSYTSRLGNKVTITYSISGGVFEKKAEGLFRATLNAVDKTGKPVVRNCSSGALAWSAWSA